MTELFHLLISWIDRMIDVLYCCIICVRWRVSRIYLGGRGGERGGVGGMGAE